MTDSAATQAADLEQRCVNTIRFLAVDAVQKANSGHPGLPMGMAPVAYVLWTRHLRYDPADPRLARPRPLRALRRARQRAALRDAAPDRLRRSRWTTSSSSGSGAAARRATPSTASRPASRRPPARSARASATPWAWRSPRPSWRPRSTATGHTIVDHRTYVIASDGDLMEGVSSEAASLAGHLGLGKLIVLYDDNHISLDGSTRAGLHRGRRRALRRLRLAHAARDRRQRRRRAVDAAIAAAKAESGRPSLIAVRSHIGYGSPNKQDTAQGARLAAGRWTRSKLTKENLGWPLEPDFSRAGRRARVLLRGRRSTAATSHAQWDAALRRLARSHRRPRRQPGTAPTGGDLAPGWEAAMPVFTPEGGDVATRSASGAVMNARRAVRAHASAAARRTSRRSNETSSRAPATSRRGPTPSATSGSACASTPWARACNGMALHGGVIPVRRYLLRLHRLPPPVHPAGRAHGRPRQVRLHPRQRGRWRGRAHAPAHRAPRHPARDTGLHR